MRCGSVSLTSCAASARRPESISSAASRILAGPLPRGSAEALSQGIAMARKGGSVAMLTVHKRVEVDLEPAIRGELHLVGAICYSYREYQRALGLLAQGRVDVEPLARHVFPLDQAQEAFDFVLSRQGVKAILSVAGGAGPADAARR